MKTVFVSSTYKDLEEHRRKVWGVLEDFNVSVRGMERFGARKEAPLQTCINEVEQSDIYVGIIGYRLGSVHKDKGLSFTQLEYERAQELGLDILIYLIDEEAKVKAKYIDKGPEREKLESFKNTLKERHTIETFVSASDLEQKIRRDFRRLLGSPKDVDSKDTLEREFEESKETIEKFLLVPKAVSGREIALEVTIEGRPFPASREICNAFNLEFGATVGISIDIEKPDGFGGSDLSHLFLTARKLEKFLPIDIGERRRLYAKLQFTEEEIEEIKTRFKSETYTRYPDFMQFQPNRYSHYEMPKPETVRIEGEGNIILLFTKEMEIEAREESE